MQDDSQSPPPVRVSPFAFMRKPMFIFSALFIAWIFLGRGMPSLMPRRAENSSNVPPQQDVPIVSAPSAPAALQDKDAQIAELQKRLEEMEAKVITAAAPPKAADDSATAARIDALEAKIDALAQTRSTQIDDAAHIEETLHKQEGELLALKAQLADTQAQALRRLSLMAAFGALKEAVQHGESFAEPLSRMSELAKEDAAMHTLLQQLAPNAESKPPTLAELQSLFEAIAPQALLSDATGGVMRHLQSLIRIRKVGEQQTGTSDEAIIARAEAKLNRGDIEATLNELSALSPQAALAFAPWVGKAQAFLTLQHTLSALQLSLLKDGE